MAFRRLGDWFARYVGIGGATGDASNPLSVRGSGSLFYGDAGGHQMRVNKASPADTASFLLQTGFSGRAEFGTMESDDFGLKVSPDGSTFYNAFVVDKDSGTVDFPAGVTGVADDDFGPGAVINTAYMASKGTDLVTNGTGQLGNNYNMPSVYEWDATVTSNLPAAFKYGGYSSGLTKTTEFLPVNPNQVYRLRSALRQDTHNHLQYMGLVLYDSDFNLIVGWNHARYREGGNDSYTTLAAPLTPGDTTISVADASGWNNTDTSWRRRGVIIFEYKNSAGFKYDYYSRILWTSSGQSMWSPGGINTSTGVITLDSAFPTYLANPDDPNGTWPIGTRIANRNDSPTYKYSFYSGFRVPAMGLWYATENFIGGIDKSGTSVLSNFSPGTAYAKVFWLPNYSNRPGGWNSYPDSGATAPVWFTGISVTPEPMAKLIANAIGFKTIKVPRINAAGTAMEVITASFTSEEIV